MSYHTWAVSDVSMHGVELNELFRFFCPLHFFLKNIGIRLGELSRADPSVCGLILAGVWVMFQVHKCCSLSIIKSRQRRRFCPCCSEPTHDVYSWPWRDCWRRGQMVISLGWARTRLSFEDTSRRIDGEADQKLTNHPPGWIFSYLVCRTGWIKRSLFGCWAPGSRDTQGRMVV